MKPSNPLQTPFKPTLQTPFKVHSNPTQTPFTHPHPLKGVLLSAPTTGDWRSIGALAARLIITIQQEATP